MKQSSKALSTASTFKVLRSHPCIQARSCADGVDVKTTSGDVKRPNGARVKTTRGAPTAGYGVDSARSLPPVGVNGPWGPPPQDGVSAGPRSRPPVLPRARRPWSPSPSRNWRSPGGRWTGGWPGSRGSRSGIVPAGGCSRVPFGTRGSPSPCRSGPGTFLCARLSRPLFAPVTLSVRISPRHCFWGG